MMSTQVATETVDPKIQAALANIVNAEKVIALSDAVKRLQQSDDYKLVIEEGYLKEEAERIFEVITEPTIANRDVINNLIDEITSIRKLKTYIDMIPTKAWNAKKIINDEEALITSIENGTYEDPMDAE